MADAMMAYPHLRHPFEEKPIHADGKATVLCAGRSVTLKETGAGEGLLINPKDLSSINGFTLKPQGACFEDLCVPVNETLFVEQAGTTWFNITAFADLIGQPYVADTSARVWSFAEVPARRERMMNNAMAPDFKVTDRQGQVVELADLKGKKALILTWSSW